MGPGSDAWVSCCFMTEDGRGKICGLRNKNLIQKITEPLVLCNVGTSLEAGRSLMRDALLVTAQSAIGVAFSSISCF